MASQSDDLALVQFTYGDLGTATSLTDQDVLMALSTESVVVADIPDFTCHDLVVKRRHSSRRKKNKSSKQTSATAVETSKRQVYRLREKCKRMELRSQAVELSEQLAQLIRAKELEKARLDATRSSSYLLWKEIADRQRDDRLIAEAEQRQLAAAVNVQAQYIDRLSGVLCKRARGLMAARQFEDVLSKKHRTKLTEAELINAYIRELEESYASTDEIFARSGLSSFSQSEVKMSSACKRGSDGTVEYFEQASRQLLPFSLQGTNGFFWELGGQHYVKRQDFERDSDVVDPENTIAVKFRDGIVFKTGTRAPTQQRFISRRFYSQHDIVYVWKFIYEGEGDYAGFHSSETAWCRLRPSTDSVAPGTSIEMCFHRMPIQFSKYLPQEPAKEDFNELLYEMSDDTLQDVVSALENMLLDDVLAGIC